MDAAWVQERLDANHALAENLGINGTPSFVIGKTLIPGAVDIGRLAQLVDGRAPDRATERAQRRRASISAVADRQQHGDDPRGPPRIFALSARRASV